MYTLTQSMYMMYILTQSIYMYISTHYINNVYINTNTLCTVETKMLYVELVTCFIWSLQATLLNPDMGNPDFRLNRTDWKVPAPSYSYNSYTHNTDFA